VANIASFGAPSTEEVEADTFDYFGVSIRLNPEFSELDYVDFMEKASVLDTMDPRAITATKDFLRSMVHGEDFDLLWQTARKNRQGLQGLMETANKLLTVMTGRPTEAPSGSSTGRPVTVLSSKDGSSSPESPLTAMDRRVIDRRLAEGRPELANAAFMAVEGRQRAQQAG
jgi:hypothetical protein